PAGVPRDHHRGGVAAELAGPGTGPQQHGQGVASPPRALAVSAPGPWGMPVTAVAFVVRSAPSGGVYR
ncbi:hypothetical protein ACIQWR_36715, partial [Streptomyces sp. NPDC098789]|uniref:hypothetical protein n=1 Tax=Streptomyces sp. NPDC098789 TaxID=3366098 RepID=UPI003830DA3F